MSEDQKEVLKKAKRLRKAMENPENAVNNNDADLDNVSEAAPETTMSAGTTAQLNYELMPGVVTVNEVELNELIDQNITMKTEIGQLVSLFKNFEGLINGKANTYSLMLSLPKLISNPEIGQQISTIQPIIEKYTQTP